MEDLGHGPGEPDHQPGEHDAKEEQGRPSLGVLENRIDDVAERSPGEFGTDRLAAPAIFD